LDLEEQILLSYLKVFNRFLIVLLIVIFTYIIIIINKNFLLKTEIINISKGEKIENILKKNFVNVNEIEKLIFKIYYKINLILFNKFIHYGDFSFVKKTKFSNFLNKVSQPSNILNKITIIEGWTKDDLNKELSKYFNNYKTIPYEDILADTYYFQGINNFESFLSSIKKFKKNYFKKNNKNLLFEIYSIEDILKIGSLIEKEGLDYSDKKNISSVILNRLDIGMRLQIDATVLYAITNGKYNLKRGLSLKDLKIDHPYNTYKYGGLPPKPISYVATKTVDIILENHKTDFLFYFFNNSYNKHIFSNNFTEHKKKLNEYRKN
tara:strand:- start:1188 stop:2153 length:966 start_codon:yes stop_codon:yes gene_type:complete